MRRSVAVWLAALALAIVEIWLIAQVAGAIGGFPTTLLLLAIAAVTLGSIRAVTLNQASWRRAVPTSAHP